MVKRVMMVMPVGPVMIVGAVVVIRLGVGRGGVGENDRRESEREHESHDAFA
jgi:hypothetical protein